MRHATNHPAARRGGFLEIDVLAALVILAALGAVLGRKHRAVHKLADTRAAMHLAEAVLTDLQAGRPLRKAGGDADVSVQLRSADEHAAGGAAADAWVEVVVNVHGGRASLTGLVPKASISPGGAP